jgi:Protein of unknown function (DUF1614)
VQQGKGKPVQRLDEKECRHIGRNRGDAPAHSADQGCEPYRPSWAQCPQKPGADEQEHHNFGRDRDGPEELVLIGVSPAALQRMTEKVSCIAWLPSTSAATSTTRRKMALPSNVRRFSRVTSSAAGLMVIFCSSGRHYAPPRKTPAQPTGSDRTKPSEGSLLCRAAGVLAIILGGFINIPITRLSQPQELAANPLAKYGLDRLFPRHQRQPRKTVIAVNVGGCIMPLGIAIYQLSYIASSIPGY